MCLYKRMVVIYIITILSSFYLFSSDNNKIIRYNYYERSYYGDYIIKNVSLDKFHNFKLLEYEGEYKNKILVRVKGYYYTGQLKFTDEILNNKIIKTDYYYLNGENIYSRKYYYIFNKLAKIEQKSYDDNLNYINISEVFNYSDNTIYSSSKIVIFSNKSKGKNNLSIISNGKYKNDFTPIYFERNINNFHNKKSVINEYYEYDLNNNLIQYKSVLNGKNIIMFKSYKYNENNELINETINDYLSNKNYEIIYSNNFIKKYLKNEEKLIQDDKIDKLYNNLEFKEWKNDLILDNQKYIKFCNEIDYGDEIVFVSKINNKITEYNLKLKIVNCIPNDLVFLPKNFYKIYCSISDDNNYLYNKLN